ncbi:MAG: RNA 2',3'-cyclic phosphodiesterase [Deltaproteobacteria bacterium]|jgi:2'-5' RNA ligase|nr:RNA 2',3'-cyclic phosphodiesterase [Deltaproteobacteria bacterium]
MRTPPGRPAARTPNRERDDRDRGPRAARNPEGGRNGDRGRELHLPPTLRLFVAISAPDDIVRRLRRALAERRDLLERFPASLHLTLRFLGDMPESSLPLIGDALASAGGPPDPELRLGPLGVFRRKDAATLWAGLDPSPELLGLKARVDSALATLPLPPPQGESPGRFTPHLTIARLKARGPQPPADPGSIRPGGTFRAGSFGLFSSVLRPEGARHTLLRAYPLA